MRAREEAAAHAGRAWLEMSRADRRRAVRLMRRIRANKAARRIRRLSPGSNGPSAFLQSAHWRLLVEFFALIEKSERRLYPAWDARETAEKCSSIFRTQLENKKGKQK